jgi:hypothetical protein
LTKFRQNKSIGCAAFKSIAANTLLTEATASERERERNKADGDSSVPLFVNLGG